jgi:hypothetical protein
MNDGDVKTFVVRLWTEQKDAHGRPVKWRGVIEHVQSGKKQHFEGVEQLLELLRQVLTRA